MPKPPACFCSVRVLMPVPRTGWWWWWFTGGHQVHHLNQRALTCRTIAGTEKIMASLNTGFVSSLFTAVFFLLIFLPSCSKYTLTKGSEGRIRRWSIVQRNGFCTILILSLKLCHSFSDCNFCYCVPPLLFFLFWRSRMNRKYAATWPNIYIYHTIVWF